MLPTQACASHTSPQGCFVHHWNVHVECCLWLHPICTMHTSLTAIFPMVGAPLCAHHTPFPLTFCQFSHTQALPHMFQIQSHCHIWTQSPTLSPTVWSDSASTPAPEALLLGGWHTHWRPTTTPQLPLATFCLCPPPSLARLRHIWTRLSVPAIPAPGAVWPTTGPKGHP